MGLHLFFKEDGNYQGWLAALLCCCAAVTEDEHPIEKRNISRPTTARNTIWNEQPTPLKPMPYFPTNSSSRTSLINRGDAAAFDEDDRVRPISERPPSLRPLSFGEPSLLLEKMHLQSRRKSSTNLQMRISIGKPTDFRRLELSEKQRMSLKPLQLSPVVLRDPEPNASPVDRPMNRCVRSVDDSDDSSKRDSYRATRGTPFERCQQSVPTGPLTERGRVVVQPAGPQYCSNKPVLSTRSSSGSLRSLRLQASETVASSTPSRPSSERIRLKRKRSGQRTPRDSSDGDIDREILELNTIVEERRAEAARPQSRDGGHIAAVAPLMSLRARSETLTDIGSAFSRPLIPGAASDAEPLVPSESPVASPIKSRLSRPFMSMPDASAFEATAQAEPAQQRPRRSSSRVAGWLSNLLGSSHNSASSSNSDAYRRRAVSEVSLCTTGTTEWDSPVASSPMSKGGHSRSLTSDSRITPPSPVDEDIEPVSEGKEPEPWPMLARHPSQVGVAL